MTFRECTVHCHTNLCDGKNTPAEMAEAAAGAGIQVLGFSGHSHTPHDESYCMSEENTGRYRQEIALLQAQYAGRLSILCGIEWDLTSDQPLAGWDYTIGSVHYLAGPKTGRRYPADNSAGELSACLDEFDRDGEAMAGAYFRSVVQAAKNRPTILGHFDLIKKLNGQGQYFDEASPRYQKAALEALEACFGQVCALEINTGGVARGYRQEVYPAPFLLRRWRRLGGEVILTADAHNAQGLLFGFEAAAQTAREAGFDHVVTLNPAGRLERCAL